tara:strand:+ start:785 stop:988 length:204 start_codon:yes stop_codon:yes gene_type:complete
MEDIVDLIASDASSSDVSDKIKDILFAKSAERLNALQPSVANSMFDDGSEEQETIETEEPTEQEQEE